MLARGHALAPAALAEVERAAAAIADALAECPEAVLCFDDLTSADSYSHSHCVRVAALGMLLGERIMRVEGWVNWQGKLCHDRIDERLAVLGLGLLLHDVGKVSIPSEILNKPTRLTESEDALIRTHPQAGASILPTAVVDPRAVAVVRSHTSTSTDRGIHPGALGRGPDARRLALCPRQCRDNPRPGGRPPFLRARHAPPGRLSGRPARRQRRGHREHHGGRPRMPARTLPRAVLRARPRADAARQRRRPRGSPRRDRTGAGRHRGTAERTRNLN